MHEFPVAAAEQVCVEVLITKHEIGENLGKVLWLLFCGLKTIPVCGITTFRLILKLFACIFYSIATRLLSEVCCSFNDENSFQMFGASDHEAFDREILEAFERSFWLKSSSKSKNKMRLKFVEQILFIKF